MEKALSSQVGKIEEELIFWRASHKQELELTLVGTKISVLPFVSETIYSKNSQSSYFFPLSSEQRLVGMAFPMSRDVILSGLVGTSKRIEEALNKIHYYSRYNSLVTEDCAEKLQDQYNFLIDLKET